MTLIASILPGHTESWRRLCQELLDSRAEGFAASARSTGVRSLEIWMVPGPRDEIVVIRLDAVNPGAALSNLAASTASFDVWLLRQIKRLIGIDLPALAETHGELVLKWTDMEVQS